MTTIPRSPAVFLTLAAGLALQACAPTRTANTPDSGLESLRPAADAAEPAGETAPSGDTLADLAAASTAALEELFAGQAAPATSPRPGAQVGIETIETLTEAEPQAVAEQDTSDDTPPPPTLDERITTLAAQLAVLARERGETHADAAGELPLLAALEALDADGLGPWLEASMPLLLPQDQVVARALADLHRTLADQPDAAAKAAAAFTDALAASSSVEIAIAELCTRVEGFGRYNPLQSNTFLAGHPHRFIVYTELAGFRVTPIDDADQPITGTSTVPPTQHRVDISQELLLYHDADGLLAWRRPAQATTYTARSRVRDFFLVDTVSLPRTLTVGSYHLKVVITDSASNAMDEVIIPIRVVADPNLASR